MPEGDTVYRAAAKLDRALTGHRLTLSDFRVPAFATVDLTRRHRHPHARRAASTSSPASTTSAPGRSTPTSRWRAPGTSTPTASGGAAPTARYAWCSASRGARPSASSSASSSSCRGSRRPTWSPTSVPTCSAPTGTRTRALANLRDEPARPDRTGAARPAQPRRHRQHVHGRAVLHQRRPPGQRRRHRRPPPPARAARRSRCSRSTRSGRSSPRPATCASASGCGSTAATTHRAAGAAPRSRSTMLGEPGRERAAYWCPSCQPER